jgi:Tape measure protein
MPFASLSSVNQIMVILSLKGGAAYTEQMAASAGATNVFSKSLYKTAAAQQVATRRTWLHNQALFTARRLAFYTTLGFLAMGAAVIKLGFSYNSTIQTARVALKNFFSSQQAMDNVIDRLYTIAALSPLLFKDTLAAFRMMYPAMKSVGVPAKMVVNTIQAITDALAVAGKTSPGQINKIGVQLAHMAAIGHPTGQVMLALARNGLYVYDALRKGLHLTSDEVRNIGSSAITTKQVLAALYAYYEGPHSPFKGAALRLANKSLQGAWQTFIDILSQASGRSGAGLFGGVLHILQSINNTLAPMLVHHKPIGLYDVARAMDTALTPSTHIVINLFTTFTTALQTFFIVFTRLVQVMSIPLILLGKLGEMFGLNALGSKVFGQALGLLAAVFLFSKVVLFPFILAIELWASAVRVAKAVAIAYRVVQLLMNAQWGAATALIMGNTGAKVANTAVTWELDASTGALVATTTAATGATVAATGATYAWNAALVTLLGTISLVIVGVTAMYWISRKFHTGIGASSASIHAPATPKEQRENRQFNKKQRSRAWYDPRGWDWVLGSFQHGGRMSRAGLALVGEAGPELVGLPGGAQVTPLASSTGSGPFNINVFPQDIYLDGKKIGTVLATAITDKEARKHGRT